MSVTVSCVMAFGSPVALLMCVLFNTVLWIMLAQHCVILCNIVSDECVNTLKLSMHHEILSWAHEVNFHEINSNFPRGQLPVPTKSTAHATVNKA